MKLLWTNPWLRGIVVFIILRIAVSPFLGPVRCRDGWQSFSIGTQGACSWHGGVGHADGQWMIFLAAIFAIGVSIHAFSRSKPEPNRYRHEANTYRETLTPKAPEPLPAAKAANVEAIKRGEAETKRQLALYFGTRDGRPPAPTPKKPKKRPKR